MSNSRASDSIPNVKLVLLGQSTVGKTTILTVADGGVFCPSQNATVGACFHIKKARVHNTGIKFHIWDTAGQDRFRALAPMYYRDAQFALLVYAIDNQESFDEIGVWYKALTEDCSPLPHIVLVANKCDLVDRRQISMEDGRAMAKKLNANFFEVSAKADAQGVKRMFDEIAIEAVQYFGGGGGGQNGRNGLVLNERGGGGCCGVES
jgi:small GTP-binding protein